MTAERGAIERERVGERKRARELLFRRPEKPRLLPPSERERASSSVSFPVMMNRTFGKVSNVAPVTFSLLRAI